MPIKIQDSLPAKKILESENIFVIPHKRAVSQDIRPVKIIILNLMPIKSETETQLLRLLGNSPLQVDIELLQPATHISKNTPSKHLEMFYKTFDQVKNRKFDGMIITGAPVEKLAFEDVDYWDELCSIMQWSKTHIYSTLHICWGAQASLYYHYSISKSILKAKLSGVFEHNILAPLHPLMRGFDDKFMMPHSRNTTISKEDILKINDLIILSESKESGIAIIGNKNGRQFFITGHPEYHKSTLSEEYFRDLNKGLHPSIPQNYFPNDNTALDPLVDWRSHANLLYINWLNYYVYQQTPYDLESIH